ncbi:DNA polymerase III subunit delta [Ruminococcus sp.]|uniref:DNA polymerase III subunit delta n=1 Tax=Ruminococcus sp. TaxID=41978 RepID=UPI003F1203ED
MANLTPGDMLKLLQTGSHAGLYYLYGRDVAGVAAFTKRLVKKLDGDVQRYEGRELDLEQLADAVGQYAMFAQNNVILIHDPPAEEWSADRIASFLKILEDVPSSTVVICSVTGFDVCGGKKAPTPKNKKLIDFFAKHGAVCNFEARTAAQLVKPMTERAARSGCTLSRQNAERIAQLCLCDTMRIGNELDKLCAYADGGEITPEAISMLVAGEESLNAFALAKAVTSRNGKAAMETLDILSQQRNEPVMLLSAITSAFLDLYRAKAAQAAGKHHEHVLEDFSYKGREFAVKNAFRDAGKSSLEQLRACMLILRDTDTALKSTRVDGRTLIEEAITRMLAVER